MKWYEKKWFMWAALVFFAPLGWFLLYCHRHEFTKKQLYAIAGISAVWFIFAVGDPLLNPPKDTMTASQKADRANEQAEKEVAKQMPKEKPVTWNTSDEDAMTNGNVGTAAALIKKTPDIANKTQAASPADVYKAPWDYYGKPIALSAHVNSISEFPPDSDLGKMFGGEKVSQINMYADDNIIIQAIIIGNTDAIQKGTTGTVYGYVTGRTKMKNQLGGDINPLIIVGRV
ncbi:hypothetical protein [Megasphaera stantonii]|uniref:Uncharacterized protein n=1 Tax=Megasphaera stantonii TaxID=2144175 RepID=A0A346B133_9FIRM|nr:hypothetical protein [Megasphaera stantonii]AXL21826.1 hypothetical protein DKB62_09765 [Megasphaera stantonii]